MEAPTSNNSFPFRLDRVVFYGRTLSEYVKMFDLDDISAEAKNKYGIHAVGCDPLVGEELKTLVERGEADIEYVLQRVSIGIQSISILQLGFLSIYKGLERIQNTGFTTSYIRLSYRNYRKTIYKSRVTHAAI